MNKILAAAGALLLAVAAVSPFVLAAMGPLATLDASLLAVPALSGVVALVLFALAADQPSTRGTARGSR